LILYLIVFLLLSSCGGNVLPPEQINPDSIKPIAGLWAETDGCRNLHMRELEFDIPIKVSVFYHQYLDNFAKCEIEILISGDNESGTYSFNNSVYIEGSSTSDPNCNSLNTTGTYKIIKIAGTYRIIKTVLIMEHDGLQQIYHWCGLDINGNEKCNPVVCGIL